MKVGELVKWVSQSRGNATTKIGTIVVTLKPNQKFEFRKDMKIYTLDQSNKRLWKVRAKGRQFNAERVSESFRRDHKSYLIEVQDTLTGKPKLYWPKVHWLKPLKKRSK